MKNNILREHMQSYEAELLWFRRTDVLTRSILPHLDLPSNPLLRRNVKLSVDEEEPVPATDRFLKRAQEAWYENAPMDKVRLFTVEHVPDIHQNDMDTGNARARTVPLRNKDTDKLTGASNVYFNKNLAFSSAWQLFLTMGHEFLHVSQIAALEGEDESIIKDKDFIRLIEWHASSFQQTIEPMKLNSYTREDIINWMTKYPIYYESMHWMKFTWLASRKFYILED